MTTLGKVIGGGLPVGAFGGKKKIMNCLAPNGPVYQAGTLSGNPLAMAAGSMLIKLLIKTNPYKKLEDKATNLLQGMKNVFDANDIPFSVNQLGGMFGFFFSEKLPKIIKKLSIFSFVFCINWLALISWFWSKSLSTSKIFSE